MGREERLWDKRYEPEDALERVGVGGCDCDGMLGWGVDGEQRGRGAVVSIIYPRSGRSQHNQPFHDS